MKHHHSLAAAESTTVNSVKKEAVKSDVKAAVSVPSPVQEVREESQVSHDMIAQLAHKYWAERGFPEGSAENDWLLAEQHLKARGASA